MKDRSERLLKYISKEKLGLEIGPYINPLASKREGFNVKILDVFTDEELISRSKNDCHLNESDTLRIEKVDFVMSAQEIGSIEELKGTCDYIISSHNLEHIPNPILFLQGCTQALKPDGIISLALPDYRCCWDRFRPLSSSADWLDAFVSKREKPSAKQVFEQNSMHCRWHKDGKLLPTMPMDTELSELQPVQSLESAWNNFLDHSKNELGMPYIDTHCWTFTPDSFKLILNDLRILRILDLKIIDISDAPESEFIVHIRKEKLHDREKELLLKQRIDFFRKIAAFYSDQIKF